jgi:hypothetical protein
LRSAGGCEFSAKLLQTKTDKILWTPDTLPSVVVLTTIADGLADPRFRLTSELLDDVTGADKGEQILRRGGNTHRIYIAAKDTGAPAALLPLDRLFEVRAAAAVRAWRALNDRSPGPNPAALSQQRRNRLVLALRALDARLQNVTYREIAKAIFGLGAMSARAWEGHDLRDRTMRLARLGFDLMQGGYRSLLLHPYRRLP